MATKKKTSATKPARSPDAAKRNPGKVARGTIRAVDTAASRHDAPQASPESPLPARVLATIPLHVRWRDLDAFNHVNNASYLTYLEESRLQWLRTVPGEWFSEHAMPVMAAIEVHYRKPITWPAEIDVQLTCERLGNSSLTIGNRIVDRSDATCVYSEGKTVMVWIDPTTGASVSLPQALRNAVAPK